MKAWAFAGMFISLAALAACGDGGDGGDGGFGGFSSGGSTSTMTGSGGAGGSTGTMTGSGGAGGGTSMCDSTTTVCNDGTPNTGDCAECAIAPGALCRPLAEACALNADCAALDDCLTACMAGDAACVTTCETMHMAGKPAHDSLKECIFCQACPTVCMEPSCMQ